MEKVFRFRFFMALFMALAICGTETASAQKLKLPTIDQLASQARKQTTLERIDAGMRLLRTAPTKASAEAETLIDEDFSAFTEGDEDNLGENVTVGYNSGDPYIAPKWVHGQEGWWGVGVFSAGGQIALALPNYGGCINSPKREMYGRLHVSFRIKVRSGNPSTWRAPIIVNCCNGSLEMPSAVNTIPTNTVGSCSYLLGYYSTDGWQQVDVDIYNPSHKDDSWIQIHCVTYAPAGYLIDDLKVTRDYDFATTPENLQYSDFTKDGFTASWTPGAENNWYLFSLMEEKVTGEEPRTLAQTFDDITTDKDGNADLTALAEDKWNINLGKPGTQVDATEGGAQALVIDEPSDMIETPLYGGHITQLNLGLAATFSEESFAYLMIDGWDGCKWETIGYAFLQQLTSKPDIYAIEAQEGSLEKYMKIKLYVKELTEDDQLLITNVNMELTPDATITTIMDGTRLDDNKIVLHNLDPEADYFYSVTACKDDNIKSYPSDWTHALGLLSPELLPASNISEEGSYTANWKPAIKAVGYRVKNYEAVKMQEDKVDYTVLSDGFSATQLPTDSVKTLSETTFDEYSDTKGWTASGGAFISDGCLGIYSSGILYSPELTLNNGNGQFKVHLKLKGYEGSKIAVQSMNEYAVISLKKTGEGKLCATADTTITFTDGIAAEEIMFYAVGAKGQGVLIDQIDIYQDVKAGDMIYHLDCMDTVEGDQTSYDFTGLTKTTGHDYAYTVTSRGNYFGTRYLSLPSAYQLVQLDPNAIGTVNATHESRFAIESVDGHNIRVASDDIRTIRVYALGGRLCQTANVQNGTVTIRVAVAGTYIVTDGTDAYKVVVK